MSAARTLAIASVLALALTGCAAPTSGSKLISLQGTTWSGTDSTGDTTSFTFRKNAAVTVRLDGHTYNDPGDTWTVQDGTLTVDVYIDPSAGVAVYTGHFVAASQTIATRAVTSKSHDRWTLTLALSS